VRKACRTVVVVRSFCFTLSMVAVAFNLAAGTIGLDSLAVGARLECSVGEQAGAS
jgi:hypothetical protein